MRSQAPPRLVAKGSSRLVSPLRGSNDSRCRGDEGVRTRAILAATAVYAFRRRSCSVDRGGYSPQASDERLFCCIRMATAGHLEGVSQLRIATVRHMRGATKLAGLLSAEVEAAVL